MDSASTPQVLVVANKTAATPALLAAVRARAAQGEAAHHLLVPNPASAQWRPSAIHHPDLTDGDQVLALALPLLSEATATVVEGTVSIRQDPVDAIEDALASRRVDEIILSTLTHLVSAWLHLDLPHRLTQLGVPTTTVYAAEPLALR